MVYALLILLALDKHQNRKNLYDKKENTEEQCMRQQKQKESKKQRQSKRNINDKYSFLSRKHEHKRKRSIIKHTTE